MRMSNISEDGVWVRIGLKSAAHNGCWHAVPVKLKASRAPASKHDWTFWRDAWACKCCLKHAASEVSRDKHNRSECPRFSTALKQVMSECNGHRLASPETSNDEPLVMCVACGGTGQAPQALW